jgi:hypothetical protein
VAVERIETSCPCLQVDPKSLQIGPGERISLRVTFDPSHDPDFRGGLAIDVTGYTKDGSIVFRRRVDLDVRDEPRADIGRALSRLVTLSQGEPR